MSAGFGVIASARMHARVDRSESLAFLCHPYHRGGVTRWMVDAASAWVRLGRPCWFIVPQPEEAFASGQGRPTQLELLDALPATERPTVVTASVGEEFDLGTARHRARTYARMVQAHLPVGVPVVCSDDESTWRALAMLRHRNPLIGVLHADDRAYYSLAEKYQGVAAALVSVSKRVQAQLAQRPIRFDGATAVIPCGIPLPPEPDDPDDYRASSPRLIWVGRISELQKRVSDLAKIALQLRAEGIAFRLDIVGDGESASTLRLDMDRAGLLDSVYFHGWLSSADVQAILRQSDIMLLPSNFEGMPVAAMEALACGCAVVASDTSGLEEYADTPAARDALWVYPRGDIAQAVAAVRSANATQRVPRRAAARLLAEEEFSIERCVDRYARLTSQLPSRPRLDVPIARWHPGDVISRGVALARRIRVAMSHATAAAKAGQAVSSVT